MQWEIVIGLEVHSQLSTKTKIFSGASTAFGAEPNTQADAVSIALPGVLPVLNKGAVERAILFGLATGAHIAPRSVFARKNYFYPDLPKGYQISQMDLPVVGKGEVTIHVPAVGKAEPYEKVVRLTRAHLEEDAGKSLHEDFHGMTGIDLNRAGTPLLEIVSEPDMRSAAEAIAYAKTLHSLVRWIGICDGNMQEGSFRCDVNVSIRRPGDELGTRREIKNLNSFKFMQQAIDYEVQWQIDTLESGGKIQQATVLFNSDTGETRSMRSKEDAHDYRYFPDPDLLPLEIEDAWIDNIKASLPELPDEKIARFMSAYGLTAYDAAVLTSERPAADFFEQAARGRDGKQTANWVVNELFGRLNKEGKTIETTPVSASQIGGIVDLIVSGAISGKIAKEVFEIVWTEGGDPARIVETRGLRQVTDTGAIAKAVDDIIAGNPDKVEQVRAKPTMLGWFVGQVMKSTGGKANPQAVSDLLKEKLGI